MKVDKCRVKIARVLSNMDLYGLLADARIALMSFISSAYCVGLI